MRRLIEAEADRPPDEEGEGGCGDAVSESLEAALTMLSKAAGKEVVQGPVATVAATEDALFERYSTVEALGAACGSLESEVAT